MARIKVANYTSGVFPAHTPLLEQLIRLLNTAIRRFLLSRELTEFAGLLAAAARGARAGRPRKVDDADAAKARQLRQKGIAASDIAKMLGVSRATVYRYLADGVSLSA